MIAARGRPSRRRFLQLTGSLALAMLGSPSRTFAKPGNSAPVGGASGTVTLFVAGDVMTGRGIDQALPHPGDPRLYEPFVQSALDYLDMAERANGPIPRPLPFDYVWGDALAELDRIRPHARIVNLETAITVAARPAPKEVDYRMNPANVPVLTAARLDCCTLANNHVLDWGPEGLRETLETLAAAGIKTAGAGRDLAEASAPAVLPAGGSRILVFAFGSPTSGVPRGWAAGPNVPGVNFLPDRSEDAARAAGRQIRAAKQPGDIAVVSLHFGPNWGYEIPEEQSVFARTLIEEGADAVVGHSSHHFKAIEVYRNKLILYGCGDLLNDYEGIGGYEDFRDDLPLMYFPSIRATDGTLAGLAIAPLKIRNFRLNRAAPGDVAWIADTLNREGKQFGTSVAATPDGTLTLAWG
jgi:poly-gamma-glutamate synthesis protein (capsule biosynthesis protein)